MTREQMIDRLASVLCGVAEDGDEFATPRSPDYHARVADEMFAKNGDEYMRRSDWRRFAEDVLADIGV